MKVITIRKAMQLVADNPEMRSDDLISLPAHELVCRTLFEIANSATSADRGSMAKANTARTMIFNRMVGRRPTGTRPATGQKVSLKFRDLTGGGLGA